MAAATRHDAVMRALQAAAEDGAPCPSNDALVTWIGHPSDAANVLAKLVRRDVIRIERAGAARRVQIAATGAWTGWSRAAGGSAPSRVASAVLTDEDGIKMTSAEIAARRVEREPCPRCGVRADAIDSATGRRGCGCPPAPFGLSSSGSMGLNHG